jgi:predicted AlkP superfamily phosphohydrolase/phosphomutase
MDLSNDLMENRDSLFSFLGKVTLSLEDVDWKRTRAYAMGNMGYIFVNLRGREPEGVVAPGREYEETLREITDRLYEMKDPETKETVVERVFRKEDLYSGSSVSDAPDLFPMPRDFRYHLRGDYLFLSNHWIEKLWLISGFHRMNGIFMAMGGPVKKAYRLTGKKIEDIAPTILSCFGTPIPSDTDGKLMADLFVEEFSKTLVARYADFMQEGKQERTLSEEDQAEIRRHLKGLGYIG